MQNNDLTLWASGAVAPRRSDREVAAQAKGIYDQARLGAYKADAVLALGAHVMEGTAQLDAHRLGLARGNEQLNAVLSVIELDTIRQAQTIQRQTFNRFGI